VVEQGTHKPWVIGSNPIVVTTATHLGGVFIFSAALLCHASNVKIAKKGPWSVLKQIKDNFPHYFTLARIDKN
jgi:hypothetical protein